MVRNGRSLDWMLVEQKEIIWEVLEMKYKEIDENLFNMGKDYVLAHCISSDCKMGAGIALEFTKRYPNMKTKLIQYGPKVGEAVSYKKDGRIIFNLVTKTRYWHKPTYDTFKATIEDLKKDIIELNGKKLAIPQLGAGLDKLSWNENRKIIKDIFADTQVDILVCIKKN